MNKRKKNADEVYTLTLRWGQRDEGTYHWAGRAASYAKAVQAAREEMDESYNDHYAKRDDDMKRGIAAGEPTTKYEVADSVQGVNEYAAKDMLDALWLVVMSRKFSPRGKVGKAISDAIARGEGRI